jgi:hypothetical protein
VLYDETRVIKYNGHNYMPEPVVILTDLYPYYEKDLEDDEVCDVRNWLWANEIEIPFGLSVVETILLDRVEAKL